VINSCWHKAKNLLKAGFPVHAYNRTRSKAEPLAADGARIHETPSDAARAADLIIAMLSDDNASRAAWTGTQGALAGAKPGAVLIESSTITPGWVEELAKLARVRDLEFLDAPVTLTLKDALTLMVIMSDNTATNMAIDRFGVDAVNARIGWLGLKDTHLYKKVMKPATGPMPADQPKFGLGKTTPREMAVVMERIGRCELAGPGEMALSGDTAICDVALKMLRNQFYRNTIPRYLEKLDSSETGSGIASKTGSLNAVRADVAIVAGKAGPMVLSIFTYDNEDKSWTADNEAEVMIGRLAKDIVEAWSPAGLDGKALAPGLGLAGPVGGGAVGASK